MGPALRPTGLSGPPVGLVPTQGTAVFVAGGPRLSAPEPVPTPLCRPVWASVGLCAVLEEGAVDEAMVGTRQRWSVPGMWGTGWQAVLTGQAEQRCGSCQALVPEPPAPEWGEWSLQVVRWVACSFFVTRPTWHFPKRARAGLGLISGNRRGIQPS